MSQNSDINETLICMVSDHEWLLFNAPWAIFQLYHENKVHFMRW